MVDFQKLAEDLNETCVDKLIIRVGRYIGGYHIGNGKFEKITGELFIMTNSHNLFRVVSDDSSIVDDFDVIGSDAIITPLNKNLENSAICRDEVDVSDKSSLRRYFNNNDEIEKEMFECVQSVPIRFREDALDVFCCKEDKEMWDLNTVNKSWSYFLEDIIGEMTQDEKEQYRFKVIKDGKI